METDYLKSCFGNCLAQALADVAKVRPSDPVEYLAHWLRHYRKTAPATEEAQTPVALSTRKTMAMQESSKPPRRPLTRKPCRALQLCSQDCLSKVLL